MTWDAAARIFSLVRAGVWAAVLPLSWYFGWINSVAFVALCSIYANLASDYAAFRADSNREIERRFDRIEQLLSDLAGTISSGDDTRHP